MTAARYFEIFLATAPGLEAALCAEARSKGFKSPRPVPGGVTILGGWTQVWRANLELRGAGRVIARIDSFRAPSLAALEHRAGRIDWGKTLRADVPFRVEATCKRSRIYHSAAAAERIELAISAGLGAPTSPTAEVCIRARIDDDVCTIGVDTSGELLHKRGFKEEVAKAPMRETMAALFLRQCGYDGGEPVVDPMCGSGTFVIEAAEIALGLQPGRARRFAFEQLATFDPVSYQRLRRAGHSMKPTFRFYGSDSDAGAVAMSRANAERAGVGDVTHFRQQPIGDLVPPDGPPGLVIVNPPYGTRIGDKASLRTLYRTMGQTLLKRFSGWRVGVITTDAELARTTGLPFASPAAPVSHGGLRVTLFLTAPLE